MNYILCILRAIILKPHLLGIISLEALILELESGSCAYPCDTLEICYQKYLANENWC